ncbi:hypothetical protein M3Y97_00995700 [Aphelenchoides bicaudatus]|nr:hypothetical protein M3Y97_00995700 [Aphelenchoides bicaudatus]
MNRIDFVNEIDLKDSDHVKTANASACNYCAWAIPKADAVKGQDDSTASYVSRHCGRDQVPAKECEDKTYNGTQFQVCYCNTGDVCTTPKLIKMSSNKIVTLLGNVIVLMFLNVA